MIEERTERQAPLLDVEAVQEALGDTSRIAYAATCVYPMAAPAFRPTPMMERDPVPGDELRLYVHIPFCKYLCDFCFFATTLRSSRDQLERYVAAVIRELESIPRGLKLNQLFVGGGTPTALPPDLLDRLLGAIFEHTVDPKTGVHTVEASPDSITPDHIRVLQRHGIGRVSMGVQSLEERLLTSVHRNHDGNEVIDACRRILDSGIILNIDLMYGLPGQVEDDLRRDLECAAREGVHSLTLYNLRVNEQTPVIKSIREEERLDDLRTLARWRSFAAETATELGYTQTRWHTFKRMDGDAARHERLPCFKNDTMEGFQFGVGMSARSHLGRTIFRNNRDFNAYLERIESGASPVEDSIPLERDDLKAQFVARSLGDGKALHKPEYEAAFGAPIENDYGDLLARLRDAGLIDETAESIALSESGKLIYDLVTIAFYPEWARNWLKEREELPLGKRKKLVP